MTWISRLVLVLSLVVLSAVPAAAETEPEDGSPYAVGFGSTATYYDLEGNPEYAVSVTGIDRDWQDYDSFLAPEEGMEYVLVHLSITNLAADPVDAYLATVELVDTLGMSAQQAHMVEAGDFWGDEISIASGETVEGTMLFEMPTDRDPLMLTWKPTWKMSMFIYLGK